MKIYTSKNAKIDGCISFCNLQRARKDAKFTQKTFADAIGANLKSIQNWEQGLSRPDWDRIRLILEVLDCDLDYLIGRIDCKTHDVQFIQDRTGLSERAIRKLISWNAAKNQRKRWPAYISFMIEQSRFDELMSGISDYAGLYKVFVMEQTSRIPHKHNKNDLRATLWDISNCFSRIVTKTAIIALSHSQSTAVSKGKKHFLGEQSGELAKNKNPRDL